MQYVGETRRRHKKLLWCEEASSVDRRALPSRFSRPGQERDQDTRYLHVIVLYTFVRYA